jgi:hypothetical protein
MGRKPNMQQLSLVHDLVNYRLAALQLPGMFFLATGCKHNL